MLNWKPIAENEAGFDIRQPLSVPTFKGNVGRLGRFHPAKIRPLFGVPGPGFVCLPVSRLEHCPILRSENSFIPPSIIEQARLCTPAVKRGRDHPPRPFLGSHRQQALILFLRSTRFVWFAHGVLDFPLLVGTALPMLGSNLGDGIFARRATVTGCDNSA